MTEAGDDHADFLARFMAVQPSLRSYVLALVRQPSDVDDIMQEVSLVLWREYHRYDRSRPFIGWAMGCARNHIARWWESRRTQRRRFSAAAEEAIAVAYEEIEDQLVDRRAVLKGCVERLGDQAREVLAMRYQQDLSLAQIAEEHGSTVNAINKILGKIRRALLDCAGRAEALP